MPTWPSDVKLRRELWTPAFTVRSSGRTLAGSGQSVLNPGDVWTARLTVLVKPADAPDWDGFVADAIGTFSSFTLGPETGAFVPTPGSTTVTAATLAGAQSLGVTCAASSAILPGQRFGLDDRLYVVARRTVLTGTTATLAIWPPLYADAAASTAFDTSPSTSMRFAATPRFFEWSFDHPDEIEVMLAEDV